MVSVVEDYEFHGERDMSWLIIEVCCSIIFLI